jgi:hypothetical protein
MIYEYMCDSCHITEVFTYDYGLEETQCVVCGSPAKKIQSTFNGKGWDHWRLMDAVKDRASREV